MFFFLSPCIISAIIQGQDVEITTANWENYIGQGRPVILRRYFEGCQYIKSSEPNWREAARMHEHVLFASVECLNSFNGKEFCNMVQQQIKEDLNDKSFTSPSYVLFNANEKKIVSKSRVNDLLEFTNNGFKAYNDYIHEHIKELPTDVPLNRLDDYSIGQFFKTAKYPTIFFYRGGNTSHTAYLSELAKLANDQYTTMDNLALGFIDCNKYPDACVKWGRVAPSIEIYRRDNGQRSAVKFIEGAKANQINQSITDAMETLLGLTSPRETPEPPVPVPSPKPTLHPYNNPPIKTALENRASSEVKSKWDSMYPKSSESVPWSKPSADKCHPGIHSQTDAEQALKLLNFYRYLYDVKELQNAQSEYKDGCMAAAYSLQLLREATHDLPADAECASETAIEYAKMSQISFGPQTSWAAVNAFIADSQESNRRLGHRRGVLCPQATKAGVGMATSGKSGDANDPLKGMTVLRVDDVGSSSSPTLGDNKFLSFPPAGPFPVQLTPARWHVQSDLFRSGSGITAGDLEVNVIRSDGARLTPTDIFIDNEVSSGDCLIFKLGQKDVELCVKDYSVTVQVYVKSKDLSLEYTVYFKDFDSKEPSGTICFYDTSDKNCPDGSQKITNPYQTAQSDDAERVIFIAEDITPSQEITMNAAKSILIQGPGHIKGDVLVPSSRRVAFSDARDTQIKIEYDYSKNETTVGFASASAVPKKIVIKFVPESTPKILPTVDFRANIYEGPSTVVDFESPSAEDEYGFLIHGYTFYEDSHTNNRLTLTRRFISTTVVCSNADRSHYMTMEEFKNLNSRYARKARLFLKQGFVFSSSALPNIPLDYEIDAVDNIAVIEDDKFLSLVKSLFFVNGKNPFENTQGRGLKVTFTVATTAPSNLFKYKWRDLKLFQTPVGESTPWFIAQQSTFAFFANVMPTTDPAGKIAANGFTSGLTGDQTITSQTQNKFFCGSPSGVTTYEYEDLEKVIYLKPTAQYADQSHTIKFEQFYKDSNNLFSMYLFLMDFKEVTIDLGNNYGSTFNFGYTQYNCGKVTVVPSEESPKPLTIKLPTVITTDTSISNTVYTGLVTIIGCDVDTKNVQFLGGLELHSATLATSGGKVSGSILMNKAEGQRWPFISFDNSTNPTTIDKIIVEVTENGERPDSRLALSRIVLIEGLGERCPEVKDAATAYPPNSLACIDGDLILFTDAEDFDPTPDPSIGSTGNENGNGGNGNGNDGNGDGASSSIISAPETNTDGGGETATRPDDSTKTGGGGGTEAETKTEASAGEQTSTKGTDDNAEGGGTTNTRPRSLNPGAIAGISIAAISAAAIIAAIAFFVINRKRNDVVEEDIDI